MRIKLIGFDVRPLNLLATIPDSNIKLKIPQARLQQYVNQELPDVQAGFRKGRGTRDSYSQTYGFSSSPVWMFELDHKED